MPELYGKFGLAERIFAAARDPAEVRLGDAMGVEHAVLPARRERSDALGLDQLCDRRQ